MRLNESLSDEAYSEIIKRLTAIERAVRVKQFTDEDIFFDNQEFIQIMHISKKTAAIWRLSNVIAFSQVGGKIYYRLSDINALLNKHRIPEKS
jgi:hypothetical protein